MLLPCFLYPTSCVLYALKVNQINEDSGFRPTKRRFCRFAALPDDTGTSYQGTSGSSTPQPPCFNVMESSSTLNSTATNALTLNWSFGFNKDVVDGVHSLCSEGRQALFYVAAHTGVIYDYTKRTQELLQVWQPKAFVMILSCSNIYLYRPLA